MKHKYLFIKRMPMAMSFLLVACGTQAVLTPTPAPTSTLTHAPRTATAILTLTPTAAPTTTSTPCPSGTAPEGLIAWWPGEGDATDVAGDHQGVLKNGVEFAPGKVGQAFHFDGIDDYVGIPDHQDWTFGRHPFTISVWVLFEGIPDRAPFVDHNTGGGSKNKWIFWFDGWGHRSPGGPALRFHVFNVDIRPKEPLDMVAYPWQPNTGQWYHVAITRSEDSYSLYLDGVQVSTEKNPLPIPDANVSLSLGQSEQQYFFKGLIDEVQIFNRALSASEVENIFEAANADACETGG